MVSCEEFAGRLAASQLDGGKGPVDEEIAGRGRKGKKGEGKKRKKRERERGKVLRKL